MRQLSFSLVPRSRPLTLAFLSVAKSVSHFRLLFRLLPQMTLSRTKLASRHPSDLLRVADLHNASNGDLLWNARVLSALPKVDLRSYTKTVNKQNDEIPIRSSSNLMSK